MKEIIYVEDSQKVIAKLPNKVKQHILALLDGIRSGVIPQPKEFKYMPIIGKGVYELRVKLITQYRVFYVTKFYEGVYVLHAFVKKTQKTLKKDVDIGVKRYKALVEYRSCKK